MPGRKEKARCTETPGRKEKSHCAETLDRKEKCVTLKLSEKAVMVHSRVRILLTESGWTVKNPQKRPIPEFHTGAAGLKDLLS